MFGANADRFAQLLSYGVVLLVAYLAFSVIRPFLTPLAWAAILALTLDPLQRKLAARIGATRAALVTTLGTALLIVVPLALFVMILVGDIPRAMDFVQKLPEQATPERIRTVWEAIRARSPFALPDDPTVLLAQGLQAAIGFLAPQLGSLVANVAGTLGSLIVMLFAQFFMTRDGPLIADQLRRILPFSDDESQRLMAETRDLVVASVGAGLTVSAVQGFIGGIALWALGVGTPVAWGVAIAICSLIPVVGATLVWGPLAIWWLLSGEVWRGLILVGLGAGVIGLVDNVLRPVLLSGRTSVSGLVVFIGLLGGVIAFGFVGLVLGPIVLVIAGSLLDALTRNRAGLDDKINLTP